MPEAIQSPPPAKSPSTILIMEPDVVARMVISDYLRDCGYKVVEGSSGDDVLTILNTDIDIDIHICMNIF